MSTTTLPETTSNGRDLTQTFESLPKLSVAEVDYFCERCGYNLHGQAVRRDPATAVMLMRCPECGTFHPAIGASSAARLWVARWARVMIIVWVIVAYTGIGLTIMAHGQITQLALMRLNQAHMRHPVNERLAWLTWSLASTASVVLGVAAAAVGALVFPHWKRWSIAVAAVAWPAMSLVLNAFLIGQFNWVPAFDPLQSVVLFNAAFVAGGLLAVPVAHALARFIVRIVIPPQARPALSHLWGSHHEV